MTLDLRLEAAAPRYCSEVHEALRGEEGLIQQHSSATAPDVLDFDL
jgi:hypothetical protein